MRWSASRTNGTKDRPHSIAPGEEWATTRREVTESRGMNWYELHLGFWLSSKSHNKTCIDREIQWRKILRSPPSRTPGASPIRTQALRWQPTAQDASGPTSKRLIHQAWNMTGLFASSPLRYIPQRRVLSEASITKSERHQSWQHFDRILESMASEYETKWSQPLPPFILRMCSASLAYS